ELGLRDVERFGEGFENVAVNRVHPGGHDVTAGVSGERTVAVMRAMTPGRRIQPQSPWPQVGQTGGEVAGIGPPFRRSKRRLLQDRIGRTYSPRDLRFRR